jgi:hypothetical protein
MRETMDLKSAHYEVMHNLGYSDDEIEADWKQFCEDMNMFLDEIQFKPTRPDLQKLPF